MFCLLAAVHPPPPPFASDQLWREGGEKGKATRSPDIARRKRGANPVRCAEAGLGAVVCRWVLTTFLMWLMLKSGLWHS